MPAEKGRWRLVSSGNWNLGVKFGAGKIAVDHTAQIGATGIHVSGPCL
jgi:hypothetical protein